MLKVRFFQGESVPDLEMQLNKFFEGPDITHASQIIDFTASGITMTSRAGQHDMFATVLYDATPSPKTGTSADQQGQLEQQKALP